MVDLTRKYYFSFVPLLLFNNTIEGSTKKGNVWESGIDCLWEHCVTVSISLPTSFPVNNIAQWNKFNIGAFNNEC